MEETARKKLESRYTWLGVFQLWIEHKKNTLKDENLVAFCNVLHGEAGKEKNELKLSINVGTK